MQKGLSLLLWTLVGAWTAASSADQIIPGDMGWIAHNLSGRCELVRGGYIADRIDATTQLLTVQVVSDPTDKHAFHQGQVAFSFVLFSGSGDLKNDEVESFALLHGDASSSPRLVVRPVESKNFLAYLLGNEAEAALQFFSGERLVRVQRKNGSVSIYRFPSKGYTSATAMFRACSKESEGGA